MRWHAFAALFLLVALLAACAPSPPPARSAGSAAPTMVAMPAVRPFREYPIGEPRDVEGLRLTPVYFQPVDMAPPAGPSPEASDIHLELNVAALKGNGLGFGVGEFVPYLTVRYRLARKDTGEAAEGSLMPMNAIDGAHYGNNVRLMGAGTYALTFTIEAPEKQGYTLHVDEATGVKGRFWRKPITETWALSWVPRKWS